jgi:hypothetical protein
MAIPFKSDTIVVPSGGAADPRVITGTLDPTSGVSAPEGSIYLRYVAAAGQAFVKDGTGDTDWTDLVSVGGTDLDGSYNFGGAGAGRIITANSGALQVNATTADTQAALVIDRSPSSSAAAVGIDLTLGANTNASGNGILITDSGAGTGLSIYKLAAGIAQYVSLQNAGAQALVVTVNAAPTSVSPIAINANTDGTTATLFSISKIPSLSTAGVGIGISFGANTTGSGITVAQAGTGAAIEISAGSLEIANSSAGVSPANRGRLRYNSGTQTFQVSLNGAAYVDVTTGASFTLDIGDAIGSSTAGSVLFVDTSNLLAQNNSSFSWNNTNTSLAVTSTTTSPAIQAINSSSTAGAMSLRNTNASGPVDFYVIDSAGSVKFSWGYGNASYSDAARASRGYIWRNTGLDFVIARTGIVDEIIDSSGRHGIGTATSLDTNSLLHVNSGSSGAGTSAAGSAIVIERSGSAYLTVKSPAATDKGILFANPTSVVDGGIVYDNSGLARGMQFRTGGNTNRLQIDSTGVVSVLGAGIVSRASSSAAGFFDTAFFSAGGASTSFAQSDRELRVTTGSNAGGQRQQYLTFNGRWSGTIDSPTLTQGLYDRVCAIEFNTAADSLGPNPNSSINFIVNTGTKGTGAEFTVTPTRAVTITYTARVGIGTTNPSTFLDIVGSGSAAAVQFGAGSSAAVSSASTGRIRYNESGQKFQVSHNAGSYFDVGTYAAALTTGSVTFANSSNQLAQDNTNFFWDNTNKQLGLGTNSFSSNSIIGGGLQPGLEIVAQGSFAPQAVLTSFSTTQSALLIGYRSRGTRGSPSPVLNGDILLNAYGYGQQNTTVGHIVSGGYVRIATTEDWTGTAHGSRVSFGTVANTTTTLSEKLGIENDGGITLSNSSSAAVSAASTGRVRYNSSSQLFEVSKNAASYEALATLATRQTFTAAQDVSPSTLTYGVNIAVDAALSNTFTVTLTSTTAQLNNPTNLVNGQTIVFRITQDATGGRALTFDTNYDFGSEGAPDLTTSSANGVDIITAVSNGTKLYCTTLRGFS